VSAKRGGREGERVEGSEVKKEGIKRKSEVRKKRTG
jgi:hypothetical protein